MSSRRLRHGPGVPAGCGRGRYEDVPDERSSTPVHEGQVCCVPARRLGGRRPQQHPRRRASCGARPNRTTTMLRAGGARSVPRLVEDGMFLVGLDIVGDKLMEINVFSPGGLGSAQKFEKVNFTRAVLDALERKVGTWSSTATQFQQRRAGDAVRSPFVSRTRRILFVEFRLNQHCRRRALRSIDHEEGASR